MAKMSFIPRRDILSFADLSLSRSAGTLYRDGQFNLYQRLIQYFSVAQAVGADFLDLINFNTSLFPRVLSNIDIENVLCPEYGYGCPDGTSECALILEEYNRLRCECFLAKEGSPLPVSFKSIRYGCGIGAGATGVFNCLLPSIRDLSREKGDDRRKVILAIPIYSIYESIIEEHGLYPCYVDSERSNGFLPDLEDIYSNSSDLPLAIVLTFPGNPAQTTYGPENIQSLRTLVRWCQENKVFLIVDNLYEDTIWGRTSTNPELLALSDSANFLCKISGPSKDRPGASGLRIGHYVGDYRLKRYFLYYSSIQYNTVGTLSRCYLALDLLLRIAAMRGSDVTEDDFDLFGESLAGWSRPLDRKQVYDRFYATQMGQKYYAELLQTEETQQNTLTGLMQTIQDLPAFSDVVNDNIGNTILIRVNPEVFSGTCHDLFMVALREANIGLLPASSFGMPLTPGEAWFRITTIHDTCIRLSSLLERLSDALVHSMRS